MLRCNFLFVLAAIVHTERARQRVMFNVFSNCVRSCGYVLCVVLLGAFACDFRFVVGALALRVILLLLL